MTDADITIIGAGVIGLAIARELSALSKNIFVIEKHRTFGQETSSRNSEVIHAGIYYTKGSLKAKLCLEGKTMLYDFCREHDIPYNNCGKIIVATNEKENVILHGILETAKNNGVDDMRYLSREEVNAFEPNIFATAGLLSPSTGIVDSHSLMKEFETDAINNGCNFAYGSEVKAITKTVDGYLVKLTDTDKNDYEFSSRIVINSAGLTADLVSAMVGISDESLRIKFCKGEYFRLNPPKNRLIKHLVYPVPHKELEGIGIHVTIDMGGGVKLGPDVTYLNNNEYDYKVDPSKRQAFYESAKKFLPFLNIDDLSPEMVGIRPKTQKPGEAQRDFYISEESEKGYPGFINLIGMESPGLTSSMAIARFVKGLIG
jgi:L-2-hydroxyglutarate oxidase LhgO